MSRARGFSLIDVIIGVALLTIVFVGLMTLLRVTVAVSAQARTKSAMVGLAESRMEYLRGVSYGQLGTVGGDPAGALSADSEEVISGTRYTVHTTVVFNDTTDAYKIAEVVVTAPGTAVAPILLVSNFAP